MVAEFAHIRGVYRQSTVRGKRRSNLHSTNYRRVAYGIDTNGHLKVAKVGFFKTIWYSLFKTHLFMVECRYCGKKIKVIARKSSVKAYICARCGLDKDE